MASVRRRGKGWQAQVRKHGQRPISKTFTHKADALTWAHTLESELERGVYIDRSIAEHTTLETVISRYEKGVFIKSCG